MPTMTVQEGEKLTLPECTFTPPEGKVFDRWIAGNPGMDGWDGEAEVWAETGYGSDRPFGVSTQVNNTTPCPRCFVVQFLYSAGAEG